MTLASCGNGAMKDRRRGPATNPIAMMRSLEVVEPHEGLQGAIERGPAGEVVTTKDHAPMLGENRLLKALDEPVGPGVPRLDPRVADAEGGAGRGELRLELTATIRQHPPQRPARPLDRRHQHVAEKVSDGRGRQRGQDPGQAVRAGRIAGGDLPDFADPLELANVERVEAEQLGRLRSLDVPRTAVAQPPQGLPGPLGQQARPRGAVVLEHQKSLAARRQAVPAQQPLHRAGGDAQPPEPLGVRGQPRRTPRRFGDRDSQQLALDRRRELRRWPRAGFEAPRVQAVHAVAAQAVLPAIEERARDPRLPTRRADTDLARTTHDLQAHPLYALVEGHRSVLPKWFPCRDFHSGKDRADGPRFLPTEVSTLTRLRTL